MEAAANTISSVSSPSAAWFVSSWASAASPAEGSVFWLSAAAEDFPASRLSAAEVFSASGPPFPPPQAARPRLPAANAAANTAAALFFIIHFLL